MNGISRIKSGDSYILNNISTPIGIDRITLYDLFNNFGVKDTAKVVGLIFRVEWYKQNFRVCNHDLIEDEFISNSRYYATIQRLRLFLPKNFIGFKCVISQDRKSVV